MGSSQVAEIFSEEWPRLVAILVRELGDLDLAEDVAQDAFTEAASRWDAHGWPDRPGAWLLTTARHRAIDRARRSQRFAERLPALTEQQQRTERENNGMAPSHHLIDDQLALLLGCCHPALAPEAQVALTLRAVGGLSTAQIARAFFVSEATMGRRLGRAKAKIRGAGVPFGLTDRSALVERVAAVSAVVYSIFTEGHSSATSPTLVRGDLCDEALWLARLLHRLVPTDPEVSGLYALLLLTDARRSARVDRQQTLLTLAEQDRALWDQASIRRGLDVLALAHSQHRLGPYQLQAAIAALHATAPSFDATDWAAIVALYDALLYHDPSAVVVLNRAVAVSELHGPEAGLAVLDDGQLADLAAYPYLHSTRGEFLLRLGRRTEARAAFETALANCSNEAERRHLAARRDATDG